MQDLLSFPLIVAMLCIAAVLSVPISMKIAEDSNIPEIYKTLENPTHEVRCMIKQTKDLFRKERNFPTYYDAINYNMMFKEKCEREFRNKATQQRFVFAMQIFQKLVGLTQDMQLSESRLNGGDETMFVRDFRKIEYKIREFVEDRMRLASFDIVKDEELRKAIPSYSVGGLIDESITEIVEEKGDTVNAKNYDKMHQLEGCFHEFYHSVLVPQAGEGVDEC